MEYSDACWDPVEKASSELSRAYNDMINGEHFSGIVAALEDTVYHIEKAIFELEQLNREVYPRG